MFNVYNKTDIQLIPQKLESLFMEMDDKRVELIV